MEGQVYPSGMLATYAYDAASRLTQLTNAIGATTITSHTYTLDPEGNRTGLSEFVGGITTPGGTDTLTYTYDGLNRLTGSSGALSETFGYDGASNLTSRTGPSATYANDGGDRVTSDGSRTFTWSAEDHLTGRGSDTFAYDALDRMTSATVSGTTATYAYSGDGLLSSRGSTSYLWDRSRDPAPLLVAGSDRIVYGLGPLYVVHGDNTTATLARDGLGSVRSEVSDAGAVTRSARYAAYGAVVASSGTPASPLAYAGELADASGLIYLRARWYDPVTSRFMTSDPAQGAPSQPASLNRYGYASQQPIMSRDPSGTCAPPATAVCVAVAWPAISAGTVALWTLVVAGVGAMIYIATDDRQDHSLNNPADPNPQAQDLEKASTKRADEIAKDWDYEGAEDMKEQHGAGGDHDIYVNKKTGDVWIKPKGSDGPGEYVDNLRRR